MCLLGQLAPAWRGEGIDVRVAERLAREASRIKVHNLVRPSLNCERAKLRLGSPHSADEPGLELTCHRTGGRTAITQAKRIGTSAKGWEVESGKRDHLLPLL